ncbi:MAG: DUF1439 domain-containing protein [Chlorobia bacterium]|nr:DUF1439 domain-containing protein [Fimbriimonadaceae bacterium]
MKPRVVIIGSVVIFVAILALVFLGRPTIRLTAADIQSHLERKFPLEKRELIFTARFTDPSVAIDPKTNEVILGVSTTVSALGLRAAKAQAEAKGHVRYEPSSGEIFLDSPAVTVQGLSIVGLSERDQEKARKFLQGALKLYLGQTALYRLKKPGPLKSLRVRDAAIEIELGY